jgi:hypothetical protein
MKKLFSVIVVCLTLHSFSQTTPYKHYFRFDVGYEQNQFLTNHTIPMQYKAWNTRSVALEFELSFKNSTAFSRNYRPAFGQTEAGYFYAHIPAGPIAGLVGLLFTGSNGTGCGGLALDALLFLIPEGFAYYPIQNKSMHFGMYGNFLALDFAGGKNGGIDYAPDAGIKLHFFITPDMFLFARASGKYSTKFGGWGAQGTIGLGWDIGK